MGTRRISQRMPQKRPPPPKERSNSTFTPWLLDLVKTTNDIDDDEIRNEGSHEQREKAKSTISRFIDLLNSDSSDEEVLDAPLSLRDGQQRRQTIASQGYGLNTSMSDNAFSSHKHAGCFVPSPAIDNGTQINRGTLDAANDWTITSLSNSISKSDNGLPNESFSHQDIPSHRIGDCQKYDAEENMDHVSLEKQVSSLVLVEKNDQFSEEFNTDVAKMDVKTNASSLLGSPHKNNLSQYSPQIIKTSLQKEAIDLQSHQKNATPLLNLENKDARGTASNGLQGLASTTTQALHATDLQSYSSSKRSSTPVQDAPPDSIWSRPSKNERPLLDNSKHSPETPNHTASLQGKSKTSVPPFRLSTSPSKSRMSSSVSCIAPDTYTRQSISQIVTKADLSFRNQSDADELDVLYSKLAKLQVEVGLAQGQADTFQKCADQTKRESALLKAKYEVQLGSMKVALEEETLLKAHFEELYMSALKKLQEDSAEKKLLQQQLEEVKEQLYILEEEYNDNCEKISMQKEEQEELSGSLKTVTHALETVGKERNDLLELFSSEQHKMRQLQYEKDALEEKVRELSKANSALSDENGELQERVSRALFENSETQAAFYKAQFEDINREKEQLKTRYERSQEHNRVMRITIQQLLESGPQKLTLPLHNRDHSESLQQTPRHSSLLAPFPEGYESSHGINQGTTVDRADGHAKLLASSYLNGIREDRPALKSAWDDSPAPRRTNTGSTGRDGTQSMSSHTSVRSISPSSFRNAEEMCTGKNYGKDNKDEDWKSYMEVAEDLERQLRELTHEKEKLQADYCRVPIGGRGGLARRKQADVEDRLDKVDRELARVKFKMKNMHVM